MVEVTAAPVGSGRAPKRIRGGPHRRALLLGFALVAVGFLILSVCSHWRMGTAAHRAHVISAHLAPGLVQLGEMRHELYESAISLAQSTLEQPERLLELPSHEARLQQACRRYEATLYATHRGPWPDPAWTKALASMDEALHFIEAMRRDVAAGQMQAARVVLHERVWPNVRSTDEQLSSLLRRDDDRIAVAGSAVDRGWTELLWLRLGLDVGSLLATVALVVVAFRLARRDALALKARAEELEVFASRVAHDVRGPLMPALIALQRAAGDPGAKPSTHAVVDRGIHSLHRVDGLVKDLLVFARAAAAPEVDECASLRRLAAEVVEDIEPMASAARVRVLVDALPDLRVVCAPGVLASILQNLVSNAVKHMPAATLERTVVIRACCIPRRVRVEVCDTGGGIPDELRDHLFEPYVRADRRGPGLGLGLATVRRLVEAHQGAVGCRSPRGGGAIFWFELPVQEPRDGRGVPATVEGHRST